MKCGLFHIVHSLPVPVPLRNVRLDVKVVDFVSQVTITQEYVNCEANPIEVCTYIIISCGRVVRDFEREAKTRCNF